MIERFTIPSHSVIVAELATANVLRDVVSERARQKQLFPDESSKPDGTSLDYKEDADYARWACDQADLNGRCTHRHVLMEEVYESFAETDPAKLRTELVQVAAYAVKWIEDIDSRASGVPLPVVVVPEPVIVKDGCTIEMVPVLA